MSRVSLVLGESGSGKSTSIENLPPDKTFVVSVVGKELPFRGSETTYKTLDFATGKGNFYASKSTEKIAQVIKWVNKNRPEIKFIVIDDNQYLSLFTYVGRIGEKDWAKFNTIITHTLELVEFLKSLRDDIQVFILQHIEVGEDADGNAQTQAKTMGRFVKEKVTYEGLFTCVLLCDKEEDEEKPGEIRHFFWTRKTRSTVKTPRGMFEEQKIPNDLLLVARSIRDYYKKPKET